MNHEDQHERDFARRIAGLPRDDAPRPECVEPLRRQVLEAFDAAAASPGPSAAAYADAGSSRARRFITWGRNVMSRPIPRFLAATVAVVLAGWLFLPGQQSTAAAFNEFVDKLLAAKSARFEMEVHIEGQPDQKLRGTFLAPARVRQELPFGGVNIADYAAGQILTLLPQTKEAILMTIENRPRDAKSDSLFFNLRQMLDAQRQSPDQPVESLGEREIDGRQAVGYRTRSALGVVEMWGDSSTGWPVRIESTFEGAPRTRSVMSGFEFDVPVEESQFSMDIPEGYTKREVTVDGSPPGEADLLAALEEARELDVGLPPGFDPSGIAYYTSRVIVSRMQKSDLATEDALKYGMKLGRGLSFVATLPADADAHYAGKGVKIGGDQPIFWYRPVGQEKYRVLYADLSFRDAETPPESPEATPVGVRDAPAEVESKPTP